MRAVLAPLAAEGLTFFGECAAGRGRPLQHVVVEEVERAVVGIPLAQLALVAQVALTRVDLGRGAEAPAAEVQ